MKSVVFDSGPLITFAINGILEIFPYLTERFDGVFYISNTVRKEILDDAFKTKKFAFEALRLGRLLKDDYIETFDTSVYSEEIHLIKNLVNNIFSIKGTPLEIMNAGELDALVLAKNINADAFVVDERTTRLLIENPYRLHKLLEKKFQANVAIDKERLHEFERHFSTIKVIRSVELALVGLDFGFFKEYTSYTSRKELVNALLWSFKLNGCAISEREIAVFTKLYKN